MARAAISNVVSGKTVSGASTITQQLVKNDYLSPERTLVRKLTEVVMAVLLEVHYSKEQILEISTRALGPAGIIILITGAGGVFKGVLKSTGIDVERVITWVWVSGAALAALSGAFFGLDQIKWDFGFRILLLIFASVTLGGLGRPYGALVGALIVGLTINLSTLFIDAEVKNMVALLMMALILMFRPQGILGRAERIG